MEKQIHFMQSINFPWHNMRKIQKKCLPYFKLNYQIVLLYVCIYYQKSTCFSETQLICY